MQFDDQFFATIGMADASHEDKTNMAVQIAEIIQSRLAVRLSEVLTDDQADQFADLLDAGKEVEGFAYLEQVCPQYGQFAAEELERAKEELLADIDEAARRIDAQA